MPQEQFANFIASTTLSADYTAGDASIHLTSAVGFSGGPLFSVALLDPADHSTIVVLRVTAVSGTTFTTTPETTDHNAATGAICVQIVSAASLQQLKQDAGGSDTGLVSALPSPGSNGKLYLPTNGNLIYRDNGGLQIPFGPMLQCTPPDARWTGYNLGSHSKVNYKRGTAVFVNDGTNTESFLVNTGVVLPSSGSFVVAALVRASAHFYNPDPHYSLAIVDTASKKAIAGCHHSYTAYSIYRWSDYTVPTFNAQASGNSTGSILTMWNSLIWIGLFVDAFNGSYALVHSSNGMGFMTVDSERFGSYMARSSTQCPAIEFGQQGSLPATLEVFDVRVITDISTVSIY